MRKQCLVVDSTNQAEPGESEVDNMSTTTRWTSADLESLPEDGTRYEIIDGELFMSKQPSFNHQDVCTELVGRLWSWDRNRNRGWVVSAPGLILDEDDDVAPDIVWISNERLASCLKSDGKLHDAPELSSKSCHLAVRMRNVIVKRSSGFIPVAVSTNTGS